MGKGRQVAGRADRSFCRDARRDAGVEQREQRIDQRRSHAGMPARQAHDFRREHQTDNCRREGFTGADAVRQHQIALQLGQLVAADARAHQLAKTGVDPVDHLVVVDDVLHGGLRGPHALGRRSIQRERHAAGMDASEQREVDCAGLQ